MQTPHRLGLALLSLPLALACSSSSSGPLASATIDAMGGTVTVASGSFAGTSIAIATNTVTMPTLFEIRSDTRTVEADVVDVGPAARFSPDDTTIAPVATATLLFDPTSLPPGVSGADLRVSSRTRGGAFSRLTPTMVDMMAGTLTVQIAVLATLWVVAPDTFESSRYLPLDRGNEYLFDSAANNNLRVVDATSDPGLPGMADVRLTLTLPWFHRSAIYLDALNAGGIDLVGLIDSPPQMLATLEWLSPAVPFLNPIERVGDSHGAAYAFDVFSVDLNNLPPSQIGTGTGMLTILVVARETVNTVVGSFSNTVKVTWTDTYMDDLGNNGSGSFSLWLARDVGPVQIQLGANAPVPLRSGTVGGQPIRGS